MIKRDFLSLLDFSSDELKYVIERAKTLRKQHENGEVYQSLVGKTGALILTMSSTRTRVAFEAGFAQMGAKVIFLSPGDTQIGRGEPLEDLARVLSEMVDIIMIRFWVMATTCAILTLMLPSSGTLDCALAATIPISLTPIFWPTARTSSACLTREKPWKAHIW